MIPMRYVDPRGREWTLHQTPNPARPLYWAELEEGHVWASCTDLPKLLKAMDLTPRTGRGGSSRRPGVKKARTR
jgi:hypothetical protein